MAVAEVVLPGVGRSEANIVPFTIPGVAGGPPPTKLVIDVDVAVVPIFPLTVVPVGSAVLPLSAAQVRAPNVEAVPRAGAGPAGPGPPPPLVPKISSPLPHPAKKAARTAATNHVRALKPPP